MAKDKIHHAVKNALIKDGWTILADPFHIDYKEFELLADLAAEHPFALERAGQKIVVEVKTFGGRSFVKELQAALGQYAIYRDCLDILAPEYQLYLGISEVVYVAFFQREATQMVVQQHHLKFITVDLEEEVIVRWIA